MFKQPNNWLFNAAIKYDCVFETDCNYLWNIPNNDN
jgi:hypothetical protein